MEEREHGEGGETAQLLRASAAGDRAAFDRLVPRVYGELRRIAHRLLGRRPGGDSWNTTALVHETYLKLAAGAGGYNDRQHFFAVSARAMRHLLVDSARRRAALKRGGPASPETLDEEALAGVLAEAGEAERILAVEEALERLADLDPRLTQVIECRIFAGYSEEETALALGVSLRSVQRYFLRAKAWLAEEMSR